MNKWLIILCVIFSTQLSADTKVLAFAGSTREASFNKKLVNETGLMASQANAEVTVIDLKHYPLPFFDEDLEAQEGMPENAKEIRRLIKESDVIFIASPNYNASFSAVLKNTIDWATRTEDASFSHDIFEDKTIVLMSASHGKSGGIGGLKHLRDVLEALGAHVLTEEMSVPLAHEAFDEQGHLSGKLSDELQEIVFKALGYTE